MKNFQLTSRATNFKLLGALALFGFAIGGGLLADGEGNGMPWALAGISVGLALFVLSIYRLVQPARPDQRWKIAAITLASLTWLMLMVAAYLCVNLMVQRTIEQLQDIVPTL